MKLLYDMMLDEASLKKYPNKSDRMIEVLKDAKVFVIDNVSDYWYEIDERDEFSVSDFPNLAPQFESMFFEYSLPHFIRHHDSIEQLPYPQPLREIVRIGILIHSSQFESGWIITGLPFMRTAPGFICH